MEVDKLEKVVNSIWEFLCGGFDFFIGILFLSATIFTVFGACASLILLYKMYPEIYLTLSGPMIAVFTLILFILKIIGSILAILMCLYIIFATMHIFKDQSETNKKKREVDRKKFMNEVVARLKKESNKK